jgi:hypothetical protein
MNVARSGHTAVVLQGGRVLVAGGKTSGGGITNAAEIYSPALKSWLVVGAMADARSGHTATLLEDGRVLLAGGEGPAGAVSTLEVFDPATEAFAFAGTMSSARKDHAAALLADGRVFLAGAPMVRPPRRLQKSSIRGPTHWQRVRPFQGHESDSPQPRCSMARSCWLAATTTPSILPRLKSTVLLRKPSLRWPAGWQQLAVIIWLSCCPITTMS